MCSLLGDPASAEDVTALAFERAYQRRRTFDRRRGEERAWLFGIARNAALDELRRRRRVATLAADPPDDAAPELEDGAEVALRRTAVRAAVAGLSARERELVALKFHAGLSNGEIATVIGMSETGVGTFLYRSCAVCGRPVMREPPPRDDETVAAALEAIDATLHGEPADPDFADFAELSLILRDERPQPAPGFLTALDARASERFVAHTRSARPSPRRDRSIRRLWWGVGSAATGIAVLVVLLLTVHLGGGGRSRLVVRARSVGVSSAAAASSGSATVPAGATPATNGSSAPLTDHRDARVPALSPAPRSGHSRDVTQSAQLVLRARAGRIDAVAQEVFDTVGAEHGTVASSDVVDRAHGSGAARFALAVPSGRLQVTLNRLSSLRGAQVSSRSDASADITGDVNTTAGRLAAAHALRRSLLAQLTAADTATLAGRLQAALRRNESQIDAEQTALARLHEKVSDSTVDVTVSAPPARAPRVRRTGTGFTISRALHDAGRVLIVAAGVVLIALSVLVPLGLLVALGSWVWALTLHRRRERALGP